MEISEYVDEVRREGGLFLDTVERADLEAAVPACPEWTVRELAAHQGTVQRWATAYLAEGRPKFEQPPEPPELTDTELLPWLRGALAHLLEALASAPPGLECCAFLPAPSPLAFWARRQAQEVAVHRVDAQQAGGVPLTPVSPEFAADGVDELVTGFYPRSRRPVHAEAPRTMRVHATDTPGATWTVDLQQPNRTRRTTWAASEADCTMEGRAADLNLALWNRLPLDTVRLTGDTTLAERWRRMAVR